MSRVLLSLILIALLGATAVGQGTTYKIMPLGDSITAARRNPPTAYADVASYRYFLWHQLTNSGRCVDFVGGQTTIPTASKPQYNNFDADHESVWSRRADEIAAAVRARVAADQPDIILCHAGSTDLSAGQSVASTLFDLAKVIDEARLGKPDVIILLAKIIPFGPGPNFANVVPLNDQLPGLVASKTTAASPVILVDHYTGWNPAIHTFDGVHPYEAGEVRMANTWFNELSNHVPVCAGAPTADFTGAPVSGTSPLAVWFTDRSTGSPTGWNWDFGDGGTSSAHNPVHVFQNPGSYTVTLTASNNGGSSVKVRNAYVTVVSAYPPVADFTAGPTSGEASLTVDFTDQSTQNPTSRLWEFGDGGTSTAANPTYVYHSAGTYTVKLTVTNSNGSNSKTRTDYITVDVPGALRIMPLGDSITQARAGQASYRYFLWHRLINSGHCVDFVGSMNGHHEPTGGNNGTPKYQDFDFDHEGHWGWRADEIAANAYAWAAAALPDVVVCHVGSNDTIQGQSVASTIADIGLIIDELRRANPKVQVFLAQIIPMGPAFPYNVSPLNAAMPALVASKTTAQSPVYLVDHQTGWVNATHSIDDVHPNEVGEQRMADTWHAAMVANDVQKCYTGPSVVKFMPFGDSITEAKAGQASYRYFLWNQLTNNGPCSEFVGSKTGVNGGAPKYSNFDQDHEGHKSHTVDQLIPVAFNFAQSAEPDVILCHVGSVDLFGQQSASSTAAEIGTLIDEFRRARPRIRILLAALIPFGAPHTIDVQPLNNLLSALVANKSTVQSPVVLVDHFTGWNPTVHSFDGVHPNELGEQRMADTWHQAILGLNLGMCAGAAFTPFGSGCAGTAGVPILDAAPGQRPIIGQPFSLVVNSAPAGAPILGVIGLSATTWNSSSLPMDLAFIGMPGCSLFVSARFSENLVANQAGSVNWLMPRTPNLSSLQGFQYYAQAIVHDPSVNTLGAVISNAGSARLDVR